MADRRVLRGGTVLTIDPQIGDFAAADVLIEGDTIAQIGPDLEVGDVEEIDARGKIVIPGFIDTHRHTWETAIRTCAPNATLDDYFVEVLDTFAPVYRPEDVYASNLAGALECLHAGITTLVDWSHINNTPEHPDAAIRALQESGIRSQYAYGSANTSLADYWFESEIVMPAEDVRRVKSTYFSSDDSRLTMALATRGPGFTKDNVVKQEWQLARELDIPVTLHAGMGRLAGRFGMIKQLHNLELLGEGDVYVHSCYFDDEEWQLVRDSGGHISISPQIELQMGHGCPPTGASRRMSMRPSLSIDVVTTAPGDMFTNMRAAFANERYLVNSDCWQEDVDVPKNMLTARDVLNMATLHGAEGAGLADRVGTLTPGKKADVVLIDAQGPNMAPVMDPVAAVVLSADVSNVDTVLVDGEIVKRDGKLVQNFDRARHLVEDARDHLVAQIDNDKKQSGWTLVS